MKDERRDPDRVHRASNRSASKGETIGEENHHPHHADLALRMAPRLTSLSLSSGLSQARSTLSLIFLQA